VLAIMAHVTFIARAVDGLVFAETQDNAGCGYRNQAVQILQSVHSMSPRCSVTCGPVVFHLLVREGVCYLALFDCIYPRNCAFAFLDDVRLLFQEELKREFGTGSVDYRSHIDTIERPHYFVRLDRQVIKKAMEYRDPSSSAMIRLQASLAEVPNIMVHRIDELLLRAENAEDSDLKATEVSAVPKAFSIEAWWPALQAVCWRLLCVVPVVLLALVLMLAAARGRLLVTAGLVALLSLCCCVCLFGQRQPRASKLKSESYDYADEYETDSVA